ncbi:IclR family transcriptional regulator [Mycolicibacterium palauense]|uniref:IclR family transcriptional regulator n=1 Tax=Mycolicibacterium palauense TaxID=2034511 RepID=UPI000BFF0F63|nr:helix-turn-helix domain-containing protein [Mycolicibacterium palauense]
MRDPRPEGRSLVVADAPSPEPVDGGRDVTADSARISPPTARVVAVLDFLGRHPHDRFGLSELARRLGLSKPTCLGIVTTLTGAGYLLRDPADKTYRLGPALITLGHTAQEALRVSPAARDELRDLCTQVRCTAALSAVVDDRITLLELVAPTGTDPGVRVGQSYPFAPPVGLMFVLWDDAALREWMAREPTIPLRTDAERLHRVVSECRADGYLVELLTPAGQRLYALTAGMTSTLPEELRALLSEMVSGIGERVYLRGEEPSGGVGSRAGSQVGSRAGSRAGRHPVSVISAPVYDHHQRQVMVVSLHIGRSLDAAEIADRATRLVATADAVSAQLGGSKPRW